MIEINAEITNRLYDFSMALGCKASKNERLSNHISFKVGGPCPLLIEPKNENQLKNILKEIKRENISFAVLGNGTNVLVPDEGIDKVIVKIGDEMTKLSLEGEDVISCSAGTKVVTLCKFALENSLSGLEFAYGIPGTCGGAVFMNAGAYGGEVKDVLSEITYLTPDLELKTMPAKEAELSYRHSVFKENGCVVVSAKFKLKKAPKEEIKNAMADFLSRRKDKQPLEYPSAGSTFKRPEGYFAGALIEQCGFKGKTLGGAQISEKHAGFLINKNGATAKDILDLITLTRETVKKETGVTLEPEVIILR
ncbi:MAG: UDP-N-acetylmuramate dehydrogenase [Acutalibacteraceae bacterium]